MISLVSLKYVTSKATT